MRCIFCRMNTSLKWLRLPLCSICRDQLYDFFWVTCVQIVFWLSGAVSGVTFVLEEVALFVVLVLVKHHIPVPWEKTS